MLNVQRSGSRTRFIASSSSVSEPLEYCKHRKRKNLLDPKLMSDTRVQRESLSRADVGQLLEPPRLLGHLRNESHVTHRPNPVDTVFEHRN